MEKKDIKNGMIVKYRNGKTALCIESEFDVIFISKTGYITFKELSANLLCPGSSGFDIVEIRKPSCPTQYSYDCHEDARVIWKREEGKEMTLAEVNAALGYKVKIVE